MAALFEIRKQIPGKKENPMSRKIVAVAFLFALTLCSLPVCQAQPRTHHPSVVTAATFEFVDYAGCLPPWNFYPNPPIVPTATQTTVYVDCSSPAFTNFKPIPLDAGNTDGQLVTFVCNSSLSPSGAWTISGNFNAIDGLLLGGSNLGSFDQGLTVNPGNGSSSSDQSCGATVMWSNSNGWWELVTIYGGTDN
jgi:hypothetical protein